MSVDHEAARAIAMEVHVFSSQWEMSKLAAAYISRDDEVKALRARVAELEGIVERLPLTADGVRSVPCDNRPLFLVRKRKIFEVDTGLLHQLSSGAWVVAWGGPDYDAVEMSDVYSTREAAEAAKETTDE